MNTSRVVVHDRAVSSEEVVAACCRSNHQRRGQATRDRFKEHIEYGVDERCYCADIYRKVLEGQDVGNAEERRAVAGLGKSIGGLGHAERAARAAYQDNAGEQQDRDTGDVDGHVHLDGN